MALASFGIVGAAAEPSAVSSGVGEGFVVRLAAGFSDAAFERNVAKYVRANHVQTPPDFRRSWRKVCGIACSHRTHTA